jgi:Right handed beta helix region
MGSSKRAASRAWVGAAAVSALITGVFSVGLWSEPRADAKTITAKCVNASTDAATLNTAIAGSKPGDQIVISGQCLLTGPVTLLGDRSYLGGSRTGTVLQQASGANLSYLLASDSYVDNDSTTGHPFAIHQLTIDCNGKNNTAATTNGLVIRSWQAQVYDLQIEHCNGDGILVTNRSATGATLANNQANGSITNNYISDSGISGVYVRDTQNVITDWHLSDNYISGSGQDGIYSDNGAGWYIDGNHLYDGDQDGTPLDDDGIFVKRMFGTSISNNYIEDFGRAGGATTWHGIAGTVQGDAASTIANNRVFMFTAETAGTSYDYIALTQVNYGSGYVTVTGNDIRGAGSAADTGFYFNAGSGKTLTVTSTGNLVTSVGTARATGTGVTISAGI